MATQIIEKLDSLVKKNKKIFFSFFIENNSIKGSVHEKKIEKKNKMTN